MAHPEPLDLESLTLDDCQPLVGVTFTVQVEGQAEHQLRLVEASQISERPGKGRQPFRLQFDGSPDVVLPQAIYALQAEPVGMLEIFIVPIGRTAGATQYEAIFT